MGGGNRKGDIHLTPDVRNTLTHLLVQDFIEDGGVVCGVYIQLVARIEELAMPNLFLEQRCVDDIELNKRVRAKLVVETADRRKYSFLSILANRMVRSVLETDAGGEHSSSTSHMPSSYMRLYPMNEVTSFAVLRL